MPSPVSEYPPVLIDALTPYTSTDVIQSSNVTFSFLGGGVNVEAGETSADDVPSIAWTETQKDYVRDIFTYISTVVDLTFTETAVGSGVNIEFAQVAAFSDPTLTGFSVPLAPGISQIVVPTEYADLDDVTLIHEIGHSLGLSHPFDGTSKLPGVDVDGDLGTFALNTELATRLSYNPGAHADYPGLDITGEPLAFGALDIAALQLLYGVNASTGAGDTVYGVDPALITIWDNGGHDLIDFSSASDDAVIDLRAATLELEANGGGYLSFIGANGGTVANGGYTIAFGVEVEEARGGSGADMITGNTLNNLLSGNGGDDMLTGGAGFDTALYAGAQGNYTLTLSAANTTIQDRRGDGDGTDTLVEIEALAFGDSAVAPFDLTKFAGTQTLSEAQMHSFVELYIAYFNRAPDAVGLNFWGTAFANGTTLEQMATLFIDQDETRATYAADLSNADFVAAVYANVLGRTGDQAGVDFWLGHLDDGTVGRDQFILGVLEGAKTPIVGGSDEQIAQQISDQQHLSIKTDIGAYYSVTKGMSDVDNAAAAMALFDGSAGSVTAAQAAIDGYFAAAVESDSGMFLMPLVGVLDDPFGGVA
ncbi:DUF4214 domain-containing protein [Sulfitobacter geojensis]|uniref:DUF4214 domain-containing protein n=1 Tax=Sulfitobacter geojensis TaxID=1342299 RepID=UPI0007D904F8|nr:DUF4214 domain-containing protein [Sulfitobacter geojensis]OAN97585.1 hypothetical protein A8B74_10025 [Sulfitobacter geojensis]